MNITSLSWYLLFSFYSATPSWKPGRYINSIFIAQLKDFGSYGKNELKRDNITLSTEIIGKFIVKKDRSEIETGELTKLLKESLSNIEEELKCLKEELNTVFTMFNGCPTGSVNSTVLFLVAQTFDEFYSKRCGNGISLKYKRYSVNSVIMKIQRRRKECVRNIYLFIYLFSIYLTLTN